MSTASVRAMTTRSGVLPTFRSNSLTTFLSMMLRDVTVLRRNLREFIPRTVLQPLLLVFVFTYVFPKIGQGIGGGIGTGMAGKEAESLFATLLVAGVVATAIMFQGIQAVALPLVQEFGYTREIEDRVLAPLSVTMVAIEKITAGALQCLLAGLIVFPISLFVPATPVHLVFHWPVILTILPLTCIMASALGLMFGTIFDPRNVPILFGVILVPITFLGCTYYSWQALDPIPWLKYLVLLNPLVYMSEGCRAGLTDVPYMTLWAVYPVLIGFTAIFSYIGIRGFIGRVVN